ncbi:MAG: exopolyphosphatase [Rhodobacterales bacterium]|nr:MAG: exopolyphosphatase [Rhodobacterales bacterium]
MHGDDTDWGPFGRPIFDDPDARALSRVGVLDIGSNSVRLVVFDGAARSPAYYFNEKILCGLGAGLAESGRLNPEGRARALAAIKRFRLLAEGMDLPPISAVATAAVREAEDGPDFCAEIERDTGIKVFVIDGTEEARLSAQGVLLGWPEASGLMCDIGGASLELAQIADGAVGKRVTSDLGPLKLASLPGGKKGLKAHIKKTAEALADQVGRHPKRLFLVGGSWRAIARIDMLRRDYPLHVLHEYRMTPKELQKTLKWIGDSDMEEIRAQTGTSEARMKLVPIAAQVLARLVRELKPKEIAVSAYGIREGLLYEQMPERLRRRDPLIEACRFSEQKDARLPGFGKSLYAFLEPIYKSARPERKRMIRAACLLHDVAWRSHPDYRHEVTFDNVTRANMGGLNHHERVFLAMALFHRYKSSREECRFQDIFDILPAQDHAAAEVLGKAMRFGSMFAVDAVHQKAVLKFFPKKRELKLRIDPDAADLFGEVAEARFRALAAALDSTPIVGFRRR